MRVLFVHDIKVIEKNGKNFFDASYSSGVFESYFRYFSEMTFLSRKISDKNVKGTLEPVTDTRITFEGINSYKDLLRNDTKRHIKALIDEADIVILRMPSNMGKFVEPYVRKAKKPYIIEMVACPFGSLWHHSWKGKILAPTSYIRTRMVLSRAMYTIYVTEKFLQGRYPTRGKAIGCSDVDLSDLNIVHLTRRLTRINERIAGQKFVIGTIGAINIKYKGHRYVFQAISELKKQGYKIEYQLVGGGSENSLKGLASQLGILDQVKFLGNLKHEDIFLWLDSLDIYMQPSDIEGLPRSIVEAFSRGCPVIGTNIGGIPELVEKQYTFKKKDIKDLERVMKLMMDGDMSEPANRNYTKSLEYKKELLDKKRDVFYQEVLKGVRP